MSTLFEIAMDVRWGDMDAFGHVNNASYLRYIEEARVAWFHSLVSDGAAIDGAPILAAATMNYRRPIAWPERLKITLQVEKIGGKSLSLGHRIESANRAGLGYADGHTVMVWVDGHGVSIPLPPRIREACTVNTA